MKKLSPKWLILEHYRKVIETKIGGVDVAVWKPKSMGALPAHQLRSLLEEICFSFILYRFRDESTNWICRNPDYGGWDAQISLRCDARKRRVDVYFCALLCRPFSKQAYEYYSDHSGLSAMDRLILMWDSREYDRSNFFISDFGVFAKPEDEPKLYTVMNSKTDLAEGGVNDD